jgi:hypothetical protein
VDSRLAALDRRVAEAATAWLTDPRDTGAYGRLVSAIEARTAFLHPRLDSPVDDVAGDVSPASAAPPQPAVAAGGDGVVGDDELLDALADHHPVQAVGVDLAGDPATVLARLTDGGAGPPGRS